MTTDLQQQLKDLQPEKEFFIGIDSDGCVFDTMEIKQKECFCPNNVLFYPVNPGHEEISWERFHNEALDKFFDGTYEGAYEKELVDEFEGCLPEKPPWL